jgi:hypothetical protein
MGVSKQMMAIEGLVATYSRALAMIPTNDEALNKEMRILLQFMDCDGTEVTTKEGNLLGCMAAMCCRKPAMPEEFFFPLAYQCLRKVEVSESRAIELLMSTAWRRFLNLSQGE